MKRQVEPIIGRITIPFELTHSCGRKADGARIREAGGFTMQEGRDCVNDVCTAIRDGLRQIGDFSYAIMPKDVAHAVGDLKKSLLTQMRDCLDWEMGWIDDRVAGGDKMREEWREKCRQDTATDATSEI